MDPTSSPGPTPESPSVLVTFRHQQGLNPWQLGGQRVYAGLAKWPVALHQRRDALAYARKYRLKFVKGWPIKSLDLYCVVYQVAEEQDLNHLLESLRGDVKVVTAEPMQHYRLLSRSASNDPLFAMQYGEHANAVEELHELAKGGGRPGRFNR